MVPVTVRIQRLMQGCLGRKVRADLGDHLFLVGIVRGCRHVGWTTIRSKKWAVFELLIEAGAASSLRKIRTTKVPNFRNADELVQLIALDRRGQVPEVE